MVRMPNVSLVEVATTLFCDTDVVSVYSGCAPSWESHQSCGELIVRVGNCAGAKVTVWVLLAGTVTDWLTVMGVPPPGGVIVAVTTPVCGEAAVLVMSLLTVSAELLRLAALF